MRLDRRAEVYGALGPFFRQVRDELTPDLNHPGDIRTLWFGAYRRTRQIEGLLHSPDNPFSPEVSEFLGGLVPYVQQRLRERVNFEADSFDPAEQAISLVHDIANHLLAGTSPELDPSPIRFVSFDDLIARFPDRMKIVRINGGMDLCIKANSQDKRSVHFPIPNSEHVVHKGGFPRLLLKLHAGAPESTISAEIPPNDFDVIGVTGERQNVFRQAERLRATADGIEFVEEMNFAKIFGDRDMDINCCAVTKDGLVYSERAFQAAKTGTISINPTSVRIYGADMFYHDGLMFAKGRGLVRLLKFVAEGKAESLTIMPVNMQIDLGIHWLNIARKFMKKKSQAPELMQKLFYLGQQIGQVRDGEQDIFDVLDRVHGAFPFFDLASPQLTREGVAYWLTRRLLNLADYVFREKYEIPSELRLRREEGDSVPVNISLANYSSSGEFVRSYELRAKRFLARCAQRTNNHDAKEVA